MLHLSTPTLLTGVVGDKDNHTPNIRKTFPLSTFQVGAFTSIQTPTRQIQMTNRIRAVISTSRITFGNLVDNLKTA